MQKSRTTDCRWSRDAPSPVRQTQSKYLLEKSSSLNCPLVVGSTSVVVSGMLNAGLPVEYSRDPLSKNLSKFSCICGSSRGARRLPFDPFRSEFRSIKYVLSSWKSLYSSPPGLLEVMMSWWSPTGNTLKANVPSGHSFTRLFRNVNAVRPARWLIQYPIISNVTNQYRSSWSHITVTQWPTWML